MAILEKDPVALRPEGEDGPCYRLRVPGLYDRVRLAAAIEAHGGREHSTLALIATLRREAERVLAESEAETRETVLGLIDAQHQRLVGFYARVRAGEFSLDDEDSRRAFLEAAGETEAGGDSLAQIERQIRSLGGAYAAMCADTAVYPQIRGIESARLLLVGWDGESLPAFKRDETGVPEALLAAVPPEHLLAIGTRAAELMRPSEDEAKNSAGPSPGAFDPAPSTASSSTTPTTH